MSLKSLGSEGPLARDHAHLKEQCCRGQATSKTTHWGWLRETRQTKVWNTVINCMFTKHICIERTALELH